MQELQDRLDLSHEKAEALLHLLYDRNDSGFFTIWAKNSEGKKPLYFKAKQASGSPLVYEGLPRFVVHQSYFVSGMPNIIKCYNHGGISKGLEIIIRGEAIEQGWVTFSSLQLESYYDPAHPDMPCTGVDRLIFPCEPKPCKLTDGRSALLCSFPDIAIPPGVNTEFPGLSAIKISDMLYDRSMILRCCATLHQGDEAKFHIIPTACQYQRWTG